MLLLYPGGADSDILIHLHLHSTMLLLYLVHGTDKIEHITNLHSTMLLLYPNRPVYPLMWSRIYIPLCFYFIPGSCPQQADSSWFTFHYASTLSLLPVFRFGIGFIFTFHYASTLSAFAMISSPLRKNLHSTMLLLYPIRFRTDCSCISFTFHYASTLSNSRGDFSPRLRIYIPLCFYFIPDDPECDHSCD